MPLQLYENQAWVLRNDIQYKSATQRKLKIVLQPGS